MTFFKKLLAWASFSDADVDAAGVLIEEDLRVNHAQLEDKENVKIKFLEGFKLGLEAAKSIGNLLINRIEVIEQLERLRWTADFVSETTILASVESEPEVFGRAIGFLYGVLKYRKSVIPVMQPNLADVLTILKEEQTKSKYYKFLFPRDVKFPPYLL